MEALAIVSLAGNVVQFVDFSAKLISKSTELYRSSKGALAENIDAETAALHLVRLNNRLKDSAHTTSDDALRSLCESCQSTTDELLAALDKIKVSGKPNRWKSIRKALRSVWDKDKLRELEGRLARFREQLNMHITADLRDQVSRLQADNADRLKGLDSTTQTILDAIIRQQDIFEALQDMQYARMEKLFGEMTSRAEDAHATTRREIIEAITTNRQAAQVLFPAARRSPCWSVPLPRNQHFVGRGSQLTQLEASLFGENSVPKVAIIGLGGVGKTQLALELAYRTKDKRPECSVFWMSATNIENIQQAHLGIAQQLRIPGWQDKKEDVRELVQHYLSQESAGQWLLVIDNADDLEMWLETSDNSGTTSRLIDSLPHSSKGRIVFTTRNRKAASKFARENMMHMGDMDEDAATGLLRKSLANKQLLDDDSTVTQLLQLLTYLPLAIVQAAAYINENDISLADYVSLFDDREENIVELLSEDFEDERRYADIKNPISTTWLISFEQIRARDALAAEYLSFMACVDPKAIPLALLPRAETKKKEIDAIGTLSAYSFITKRPADNCFDLHRLVHLATRNWLREQNLLETSTQETIERISEVFPNEEEKNRGKWRSYFPHIHYLQASDVFQKGMEEYQALVSRYGWCLYMDGRYKESETAFRQVVETRKRVYGENDIYTTNAIAGLAATLSDQGHTKEAERLELQVLDVFTKTLGKDDQQTLVCMDNLASTYKYQERWKDAEDLGKYVLATRTEKLGKEHPDTLMSMKNLLFLYSERRRWAEAEAISDQVVDLHEKIFGWEHSQTLGCIDSLMCMAMDQGRLEKAEKMGVGLVKTSRTVLGPRHPDTRRRTNNLALTYRKQGRKEEAQRLEAESGSG